MSIRLQVENYRVLRKIDWELPKGVCALVGPNGSGKTTLLDVPAMLRDFFLHGVLVGFNEHGHLDGLRNLRASKTDKARLAVESDGLQWAIDLAVEGLPMDLAYEESVTEKGTVVGRAVSHRQGAPPSSQQEQGAPGIGDKSALRSVFEEKFGGPAGTAVASLADWLVGYRFYQPYDLADVRRNASSVSADMILSGDGRNVFSVLRNWYGRRDDRDRYEFVVQSLAEAFPDTFEHLDFEPGDQTVTARIFGPRATRSLPIRHAPSGLLTALLHLTAVASTQVGGSVAIDEPENGLHPYAIKRVLRAIGEWADDKNLAILLATHSPVVLDQFKGEPEHLFVMEPGHDALPIRLDQVRDREWLAQFSLGDLYKAGDFGAPAEGAGASV